MPTWIFVENVKLQLEEGVVVRGSETIQLRPLHLQLLRYFLQKPGEVISQDEFLAEIWTGKYVTDDVVRRAIASLRRDLGDDAAEPIFIETVPRRGYRWLAEVRDAPEDPEKDQISVASEIQSSSSETTASESPVAWRPRDHSWRSPVIWLIGCALLGIAIAAFFWRERVDQAPKQAIVDDTPIRLLMGSMAGAAARETDSQINTLLRIALDHMDGIDLASTVEVELGLDLMRVEPTTEPSRSIDREVGIELCKRLNVRVLILPTLLVIGDQIILELALVDAPTNEPLGRHKIEFSDPNGMLETVETAASWVASTVLGSTAPRDQEFGALERATTGSLVALTAYSRGTEALDEGKISKGLALLQTALEDDPTFPLARLALARAMVMSGASVDVAQEHLEMIDSSHLSQKEQIYIKAWSATLRGDEEAAMVSWTLFRDLFPREPAGYLNLAAFYRFSQLDYIACLQEVDRLEAVHPGVIELDSGVAWRWASCAVASGRTNELVLKRTRQLAAPDRLPPRGLHLLLALGKLEEAAELFTLSFQDNQRAFLLNPPTVYRLLIAAMRSPESDHSKWLDSLGESALKESHQPSRYFLKMQLAAAPLAAAAGRSELTKEILSRALKDLEFLMDKSNGAGPIAARYALASLLNQCRRNNLRTCQDQVARLFESLPDCPCETPADHAIGEILAGELAWSRGELSDAEERFRVSITYVDSMAAHLALLGLAKETKDPEAANKHKDWLRGQRGLAFIECFSELACYDQISKVLEHHELF